MPSAAVIVTNTRVFGSNREKETGLDIRELAYVWTLCDSMTLVLASIKGGEVFIDPISVKEGGKDPVVRAFLDNENNMKMLKTTRKVCDLSESEAHCAILIGGHGCLFDFDRNEFLGTLLHRVWFHSKGMIAAIDQGALALAGVKSQNGELLIKGRKITCTSDAEEQQFKEDLPFMVQDKLQDAGALISVKGPMEVNVIVEESGRMITAQNWSSSPAFIEKIREVKLK